jgi:hypothetical protein
MIKIISGTVRTSQGLKTSKDKPFSLPPKEEQRFIDRKVAARVFLEEVMEPVATPPVAPQGEGVDVNTSEQNDAQKAEEASANLDVDQLKSMKLDDLKQLAKDMGVDTTGLRSREDYAKAIAAIDVIVEPDLTAEDVVE